MKFNGHSVVGIYHNTKTTHAVIKDGSVIWKLPDFDIKELASSKPKESYDAEVGDLLVVDKNNDRYLFSRQADFEWLKEEGYKPLAICTVPGKFNIYGDCSINCISLRFISKENPAEGTIYAELIRWNETGETSYDYGSPVYNDTGVHVTNATDNIRGGYIQQPILPSNYWGEIDTNETTISNDGIGWYLKEGVGNNSELSKRRYSPSPYLADQTQNPLWWYSDSSTPKTLQNWLDWESDKNHYMNNFYEFNEDGTLNESCGWENVAPYRYVLEFNPHNSDTKGEWHIGSTGEMGIMFSRIETINQVIDRLRRVYGFEIGAYFSNQSLMTSSTSGDTFGSFRVIGMLSGVISRDGITSSDYCRPLIKFENTTDKVKVNLRWDEHIYSITLNGRVYYQWNKRDYIEIPAGEELKWEIELGASYKTEEALSGKFIVEEETTLGVNDAYSTATKVADIILANRESNELRVANPDDINEDVASKYIPIGIVTTPPEHDVYCANEFMVVGLRTVSEITPETGAIDEPEYMPASSSVSVWTGISAKKTPINSNPANNNKQSTTVGNGDEFYIGSTKDGLSEPTSNPIEFVASSGNTLCTPYLSDGSLSSAFGINTTGSSLSTTINKVLGRSSTNNAIKNFGEDIKPTWNVNKYKTPGTNAGDWFVAGFGELVYFVARYKEIVKSSEVVAQYWSDEFKYSFNFDDETLVSIVMRDNSGTDNSTRLYAIRMSDCKCVAENMIDKNDRVWLPFTRFTNDTIKVL